MAAWFHNISQYHVYQDVYSKLINKVPEQRYINIAHMEEHSQYFAGALDMCRRFGLLPLMQVKCDYVEILIAQFYSTVYFGDDDARTLKWMTQDKVLESTWGQFTELLGYRFYPRNDTAAGWRIPWGARAMDPSVLEPLYIEGLGVPGLTKDLLPLYDIMNRIYLDTIAVKGGDYGKIHNYHVDLMYHTYIHANDTEPMDVMDVLWRNLYLKVMERISCAFGPFIMKLILFTWNETFGTDLMADMDRC